MKRIVTALIGFLLFSLNVQADNWNWGPNAGKAQIQWKYFSNMSKAKRYDEALIPCRWLLANAPQLHDALYSKAITAYHKVEKGTKDATRKAELQDTILLLYDLRIQHFGKEASNLDSKGNYAYYYLADRQGTNTELYQLYSKIYELNGDKMNTTSTYYLMKTACEEKKAGKLQDDDILDWAGKLNEVLEHQAEKVDAEDTKEAERIEKMHKLIEKELSANVEITCEIIDSKYGADFKASPNEESAKKIFRYSLSQRCYSNELFIEATTFLNNAEPSSKYHKYLAKAHKKLGQLEEAHANYLKAAELEEETSKKAGFYLDMANISSSRGQYAQARTEAKQALAADPSNAKQVYTFIGDLYYSSTSCEGNDPIKKSLHYLAAYEMYQKAGNQKGMTKAKSHFPTTVEIFERNKKEGEKLSTGCWINETVTLRKK